MTKTIKLAIVMSAVALMPLGVQAGGEECAATTAGTCPASKQACCAETAGTCSASKEACSAETAGTCPASKTAGVAQTAGLVKVAFVVDGISCADSANKLTKALNSIDGVKDATACAESKQAKLAYDPKKVKDAQMLGAMEKAGFKVKSELIQVSVEGMSCGACSTKVGNVLSKLNGVNEQKVCHVGKNAVVNFDPKKVSRDQILAAIDTTGFKVVQ